LKVHFSEIASLQSTHDDMSVRPCDNCTMIMVNYADLWLLHSRVASLLDGARLELRELNACSTLLVLAPLVICLDLIWRLRPLRLKILSTNLIILLAAVFSSLRVMHAPLSRVSFSMLLKRTPSFSRRLPI
jgi:hypothetical protein